jgi:hypothetical protein
MTSPQVFDFDSDQEAPVMPGVQIYTQCADRDITPTVTVHNLNITHPAPDVQDVWDNPGFLDGFPLADIEEPDCCHSDQLTPSNQASVGSPVQELEQPAPEVLEIVNSLAEIVFVTVPDEEDERIEENTLANNDGDSESSEDSDSDSDSEDGHVRRDYSFELRKPPSEAAAWEALRAINWFSSHQGRLEGVTRTQT